MNLPIPLSDEHAAALKAKAAAPARASDDIDAVRGDGAWMQYAGFVESGDRHSSQTTHDLIYGVND